MIKKTKCNIEKRGKVIGKYWQRKQGKGTPGQNIHRGHTVQSKLTCSAYPQREWDQGKARKLSLGQHWEEGLKVEHSLIHPEELTPFHSQFSLLSLSLPH